MRILAIHDGLAPGHVRLIKPLRELVKHGHDVRFVVSGSEEAVDLLRDNAADYDVIVAERLAGYDGMRLWRRARHPHNRLVYETDDDLFSIDKANWAAYEAYSKPVPKEAIEGYCALSDIVTVSCRTLGDLHIEHGARKVAILTNCIPGYVLGLPHKEFSRRPRIGWIGGGSHMADIQECVPAVRRFLNKNADWDLYLGGTDYRPTFNPRDWSQMSFTDWKPIHKDERAYYKTIDFDIGIAPVRDTAFGRSKSYLKALEFNARGIPVVASDVQPYREYIQHGVNGFLAKNEKEWSTYLRLLAGDPGLRESMGRNGKQIASQHTYERNWKLWERVYEELF